MHHHAKWDKNSTIAFFMPESANMYMCHWLRKLPVGARYLTMLQEFYLLGVSGRVSAKFQTKEILV